MTRAEKGVIVKRAMLLLALVAAAGCGDDTTSQSATDLAAPTGDLAVPDLGSTASVARGEELVEHVLLCGSCHTTPDASGNPSTNAADFLAGGKSFTVDVGGDAGTVTVYAPNLTPDDATGLGMWTESQIRDAIKVGVDADGMPLWPTMPYQRFANLTDDDAMSIALYLKSLPAQSHTVREPTGHPALASTAYDFTTLPHTTLPATDANYASAERGRYLANLACVSCHTSGSGGPAGVGDVADAYAGGKSFGPTVESANLTPDVATGLGSWTADDIVQTLKTDLDKGTGRRLAAPMPGGMGALGGMSDADLTDVANFLHTIAPVHNGPFGPVD